MCFFNAVAERFHPGANSIFSRLPDCREQRYQPSILPVFGVSRAIQSGHQACFLYAKGVIIKDFYFNQKKLSRQKEQVNEVFQDDPSDPQKRYFSLRGISTPYSIGDAQQANFEPGEKLTVRYIKNGRTYYAKIPFEKLRISFARPPMDH